MMLDPNMTVRTLALEVPHATRIFEQLGIDYCCGGAKSLDAACAAAGLSTESVVESLVEAARHGLDEGDEPDFRAISLADLISHIVTRHHIFAKQELERLDALTTKVCGAHGENHPELLQVKSLFVRLRDDLQPHMMKEELVLFPYVVRMEQAAAHGRPMPSAHFGTVRNPVRVMSVEHDTAGELLRQMRRAALNYTVPADACISYRTLYQTLEAFEHDLHQHIHLENNILFPRALELEDALLVAETR